MQGKVVWEFNSELQIFILLRKIKFCNILRLAQISLTSYESRKADISLMMHIDNIPQVKDDQKKKMDSTHQPCFTTIHRKLL